MTTIFLGPLGRDCWLAKSAASASLTAHWLASLPTFLRGPARLEMAAASLGPDAAGAGTALAACSSAGAPAADTPTTGAESTRLGTTTSTTGLGGISGGLAAGATASTCAMAGADCVRLVEPSLE